MSLFILFVVAVLSVAGIAACAVAWMIGERLASSGQAGRSAAFTFLFLMASLIVGWFVCQLGGVR